MLGERNFTLLRNKKRDSLYDYFKVEYLLIALCHLFYIIYYVALDYTTMWIYNVVVFIMYGIWIIMISYKYYSQAMYMLFIEIMVQTVYSSIMVGSSWGFSMFNFIILVPAIFRIKKDGSIVPQRFNTLLFIVIFDMISYFTSYYISLNFVPYYPDSINKDIDIFILYAFNSAISFISVVYIGYKLVYYMYKNEKAMIVKNHILSSIASVDPLTKLNNRRSMQVKLNKAETSYHENYSIFSVLMMDIDFFKKINDLYGHTCGDHVLKAIAVMIQSKLRAGDYAARWGGEEFLVLLQGTCNEEASIVAERIRKAVEENPTIYEGQTIYHTITIGVATICDNEELEDLINRADNNLYLGKNSGRNKVVSR